MRGFTLTADEQNILATYGELIALQTTPYQMHLMQNMGPNVEFTVNLGDGVALKVTAEILISSPKLSELNARHEELYADQI